MMTSLGSSTRASIRRGWIRHPTRNKLKLYRQLELMYINSILSTTQLTQLHTKERTLCSRPPEHGLEKKKKARSFESQLHPTPVKTRGWVSEIDWLFNCEIVCIRYIYIISFHNPPPTPPFNKIHSNLHTHIHPPPPGPTNQVIRLLNTSHTA